MSARRARTIAASAAAAICTGLGSGACDRRGASSLEREVSAQLGAALRPHGAVAEPVAVRCAATRCQARLSAELTVGLALERRAEGVRWQLEGVLVATRPIEAHLVGELAALGLLARPACGAAFWLVTEPMRRSCALGAAGVAWVALRADGSYALEVALGAAAAAREGGPGPERLDELSRALDTTVVEDEPLDDGDQPPEPALAAP